MSLIPFARITIVTPATVPALMDALQQETRPRGEWDSYSDPDRPLRLVQLSPKGFRVEMRIPWTNMGMIGTGRFMEGTGGTTICVTMRPLWLTVAFLAFCFGVVILATTVSSNP